MKIPAIAMSVAAVMALPSLAWAQATGQSPSELILGAPSAPPPSSAGVLPAGGPPWPGPGTSPLPAASTSASSASSTAASSIGGGATVAAPLSGTAASPLVVPDVGVTTNAPADVATPTPPTTTSSTTSSTR